jgi:hypothetical protein
VVSGRDRFATYELDGTGLDYARNRYYYRNWEISDAGSERSW